MSSDDQTTASGPKTVLIVEDNALNLRFISDLLGLHRYSTLTTSLGRMAVQLALRHKPHLLDIQLPDISGMEVARELKADEETRAIPIIAVTAFAMSNDR